MRKEVVGGTLRQLVLYPSVVFIAVLGASHSALRNVRPMIGNDGVGWIRSTGQGKYAPKREREREERGRERGYRERGWEREREVHTRAHDQKEKIDRFSAH